MTKEIGVVMPQSVLMFTRVWKRTNNGSAPWYFAEWRTAVVWREFSADFHTVCDPSSARTAARLLRTNQSHLRLIRDSQTTDKIMLKSVLELPAEWRGHIFYMYILCDRPHCFFICMYHSISLYV